jgi:hypothetical protein
MVPTNNGSMIHGIIAGHVLLYHYRITTATECSAPAMEHAGVNAELCVMTIFPLAV